MKKYKCIIVLLLIPIAGLSARGAIEKEREYREELDTLCLNLFNALESEQIAPEEGKESLRQLRIRYNRPFTDSDGILESLFDRIAESDLTAEEALYEFELLKEGKLMSYRQDRKEESASGSPGDEGTSGNNPPGDSGKNPQEGAGQEKGRFSSEEGMPRKDGR